MHPAPSRRATVGLSAASFGVLGGCLTLPGTLLPVLLDRFRIGYLEAGSMLALQPVGYLLSVLAAGPIIRRSGMRAVLSGGMLASALGYAGFGLAAEWVLGAATLFVTGLGFGFMEVATNTLLITAGGAARTRLLNFAHLFFGVTSVAVPPLAARAVAAGASWCIVFTVSAAVSCAVGLGWLRWRGEPPAAAARTPPPGGHTSRLRYALAALLALYVGTEGGIGGWLTKYMTGTHGVSLTYAGDVLALYWLGLTAGRLILSASAHRVRDEHLLVALAAVATVSLGGAVAAARPWTAAVGFAATGLGFSGIFPAVIALGGRHHPHDVAGATSIMIAGAGLGGIVIPWMMSALAGAVGLSAGMRFYAAVCGVLALSAALLLPVLRRTASAPA